jgi:hypothetical protein
MGVDVADGSSEWGIIGGTGEFAMARGVIKREFDRNISGGKQQRLTIHAFCVSRVSKIFSLELRLITRIFIHCS